MRDDTTIGGWLAFLGAAGIAAVSLLYAIALPVGAPLATGMPIAEAMVQQRNYDGLLQVAGGLGIVADFLLVAGALLLGLRTAPAVADRRLMWLLLALSTSVFFIVDALAGQVLGRLAAAEGSEAVYYGVRLVYDATFVLGVAAIGCAFLAGGLLAQSLPPVLRYLSLALGIAGVLGFGLYLIGTNIPLLLGGCVGGAAVLGAVIAVVEMRGAGRAT
jgi:hypothetical protein